MLSSMWHAFADGATKQRQVPDGVVLVVSMYTQATREHSVIVDGHTMLSLILMEHRILVGNHVGEEEAIVVHILVLCYVIQGHVHHVVL